MISIIKEGKLFDYSKSTISKVIDILIECIENNKNNSIKILECGSGTSNVTHEIVKYLRPFDSITCVEINEQNVLKARNKLKKDGRVTIHRMDFCDYKQPTSYDFILNMIPCNPIIYPLDIIWDKVLFFSKKQGIIVTLPYSGNIMKLIPSNKYHFKILKRWSYYNNLINKYQVSTRLSLINIPPCYVICLKK